MFVNMNIDGRVGVSPPSHTTGMVNVYYKYKNH